MARAILLKWEQAQHPVPILRNCDDTTRGDVSEDNIVGPWPDRERELADTNNGELLADQPIGGRYQFTIVAGKGNPQSFACRDDQGRLLRRCTLARPEVCT